MATAGDHVSSVALDEARAIMLSVKELVIDGPRAALISRDGYHRPHTRGGGYNRESHDKFMAEASVAGGHKKTQRPRHPLSTKEVDSPRASFGGDIKNASMRRGKPTSHVESEVPVPPTKKGHILLDWPYNRGSTPPAFHPLPLYKPIDARDENGALKEPDGRVMGRNYFSNHSRSMITAGGWLNGLPRAGDGYRPNRVCGKGVIEETKAAEQAAQLAEFEKFAGDDGNLKAHVETLRKTKVKSVPIESQIEERVVSLHGGGEWGTPLEFIPIQLTKAPDLLELDLSSNKLRRIPDSICNMRNLVRMNLDSNGLEALPQGMNALKSLTWLSCCNNSIDRVPLSFANMPAIKMADFSNNKIPVMLEHVACVSTLTTLSFHGNVLNSQTAAYIGAEAEEVIKMADLWRMASLVTLNLECNKLTHVPIGLSALKALKFLRLGRNLIESRGTGGTSYPELSAMDAMRQLKHLAGNLVVLELHQNRVDWIPDELCSLSRLTHLDFSANQIAVIPDQGGCACPSDLCLTLIRCGVTDRLTPVLVSRSDVSSSLAHFQDGQKSSSFHPGFDCLYVMAARILVQGQCSWACRRRRGCCSRWNVRHHKSHLTFMRSSKAGTSQVMCTSPILLAFLPVCLCLPLSVSVSPSPSLSPASTNGDGSTGRLMERSFNISASSCRSIPCCSHSTKRGRMAKSSTLKQA